MKTITDIAKHIWDSSSKISVAKDAVRYDAVRRLTPDQFTELHKRNLEGENFDGMVEQLAVAHANRTPQ